FSSPAVLVQAQYLGSNHGSVQMLNHRKQRKAQIRFGIRGRSPVPEALVSVRRHSLPGRTGRQVNSLAGLGRLSGGIEDFSDDEVDLERREASGFEFAANDGGEVGNLVGKG